MARGDMFLKLESAKQGPIKGESQDETHKDEIDVVSWSWGMHARTALGGAGPTGKTTLDELNVVKRVDSASTPTAGSHPKTRTPAAARRRATRSSRSPTKPMSITLTVARVRAATR